MMLRLMVDDIAHWARDYKVGGWLTPSSPLGLWRRQPPAQPGGAGRAPTSGAPACAALQAPFPAAPPRRD